MELEIVAVTGCGPDIRQYELACPDRAPWDSWEPGAHIEVALPLPGGSQSRRYSLVGLAGKAGRARIAVRRMSDGRGGSRFIHEQWRVGSRIASSEPKNSFRLDAAAREVTFIAGGIGITPLVGMALQLHDRGTPFEFHFIVRSRDRLCLFHELKSAGGANVHAHVTSEGARPRVADLIGSYRAGRALYGCGPTSMLDEIAESSRRLGWPASAVHVESFGTEVQPGDQALRVQLGRSGREIVVSPPASILDTLLDCGEVVTYGCKSGTCGACLTTVLKGSPIHRDRCLTEAQRAIGMCVCTSWASSDELVLDL